MSEDAPITRKGKIASLPAAIRESLNHLLFNGARGPKIITWLHSQEEVLRVLDEGGEEPITPQNLSEWRKGGYADWLARRERVEEIKILSSYAAELAEAAGASVSDGAAAILGGKILAAAEKLAETPEGEKSLVGLALSIAKLRDSDSKLLRARVAERNADQKDQQLSLDQAKFERTTAQLFIKWAASSEAQAILGSGDTKTVQMDKLVQLFFGERPSDLQGPEVGDQKSEVSNQSPQ